MTAGEDVEAVQTQSDSRVVGDFDDPPRASVVVDELPPRQRLERDAQPIPRRELTEAAELVGGDLVVVDGRRRNVAAHQHRVDPQARSRRERGVGTPQVVGEQGFAHALDVAKRLIQAQLETQSVRERPNLFRRLHRGDEVGFEDLDTVEPGVGTRVELLDE